MNNEHLIDAGEIEERIRNLLDRNGFATQKIPSPEGTPQQAEAFRLRVMQPLKFSVEIVKPLQMKDFLFIGGRLNVSPQHQEAIEKMDSQLRERFFDDLRTNLAMLPPNFKLEVVGYKLVALDVTLPVIIGGETLAKDLFTAMDTINKEFFYMIFIIQKYLREGGINVQSQQSLQNQPTDRFYL
ncbi:MAG TPA: DUF2299 family protein [Candidatus Hodarchaeales archaeon]|nr:DUF2299 family protein [Candidatus Hodarchaeales archaeon]